MKRLRVAYEFEYTDEEWKEEMEAASQMGLNTREDILNAFEEHFYDAMDGEAKLVEVTILD